MWQHINDTRAKQLRIIAVIVSVKECLLLEVFIIESFFKISLIIELVNTNIILFIPERK
jgi:hypothetical protein